MDISLLFYLINIFDNLSYALLYFVIIIVLSVFPLFIFFSSLDKYSSDAEIEFSKSLKKAIKPTLLYVAIPMIVVLILIPSKQDMYIISGLVIGERIVQSDKGNEILNKSYDLIIQKLEEHTKEEVND